MFSRIVFFLLACDLAVAAKAALPERAPGPKRVLVVHSFGTVAPPFTTHSVAFETELVEKMGERVDLDEVSLDMARYAEPNLQEALVDYLLKRQANWQPDLVVPIGSPAGVFVAQYRDRLFPNAPILYTGMDRRRLPPDALDKNAAFVGESFDLPGFVEDILRVAPATKNIAVVIGASQTERYWADAFRKEFEPYANRINFIWLNDLSLDEMLEKSRTLPPDSFIFLILLLRDASGVTHNADEALQRLHRVANAPINGIFLEQLGLGIMGGRLYQAELEGQESARIAMRILRGEPPSNFPPKVVGPLPPRYDGRELNRWKISEDRLPPGSVVLFREPTTWKQYGVWIIGGATICLVQALLIFGLVANLAKRRRAEHQLSESEDRVALAADAAHLGAWEMDLSTNKVWVSEKLRELFQIPPGTDVDYEALQQRVYPGDRAMRDGAVKRAIETKGSYEIEYRIVLPDGTPRWINGRARCTSEGNGQATRLIGVAADVTKRKQAEELFKLTTEALPNGTLLVDDQGRIVLVNARAEEMLGYSREELIGEPVETFLPKSFAAQRRGILAGDGAASRDDPKGASAELFARRKDGTEFPVEINLNPISTPQGMLVLESVVDISSRKAAEAETRRLRDEIAHVGRVSMMGQLASSLAHEINQPLGAILRNAEAAELFLESKTPDLEEIRAILAEIRADDQRAGSVIDRMRALLKRHVIDTQPLDLVEVVGDVAQLARPDAATRRVKLSVKLPPHLPSVRGDRVHLQQVLLNLIVNGMDALNGANPEDRRVTVSARVGAARTVEVSVSDTGHGIATDKIESVFDPFFTTKTDGMGMGLPISRTIVESHGGRLWVESNNGTGATFRFTLPLAGTNGASS